MLKTAIIIIAVLSLLAMLGRRTGIRGKAFPQPLDTPADLPPTPGAPAETDTDRQPG